MSKTFIRITNKDIYNRIEALEKKKKIIEKLGKFGIKK